ncbi:MAG: 4Fe-4S dicluster domain-containing protein [Planctomycetota bacterium]
MGTNRRDFLKLAGAVGVASVAGTKEAQAEPVRRISEHWLGMLTDLSLCVGCRKCEWACKDANGLPNQQSLQAYEDKSVFERERRMDAANYTVVNRYPRPPAQPARGEKPIDVKKQCLHCFEPACASACLVAAFRKTAEGAVLYNEDVCIGCRYCMVACPFLVPAYSYDDPLTPAVKKCTLCYDRITKEGGVPACAKICPEEAIIFGKRSDLLALAREKIRREPEKYVDHVYGEYEVGGTCWLYISAKPFEELGFRTDLDATPRPAATMAFLSAVPLVLIMWPALLMGSYAFTRRREELAKSDEVH